eukprot:SAG22_NODE_126_length_18820_cov_10.207788_3_plen_186_part_00
MLFSGFLRLDPCRHQLRLLWSTRLVRNAVFRRSDACCSAPWTTAVSEPFKRLKLSIFCGYGTSTLIPIAAVRPSPLQHSQMPQQICLLVRLISPLGPSGSLGGDDYAAAAAAVARAARLGLTVTCAGPYRVATSTRPPRSSLPPSCSGVGRRCTVRPRAATLPRSPSCSSMAWTRSRETRRARRR